MIANNEINVISQENNDRVSVQNSVKQNPVSIDSCVKEFKNRWNINLFLKVKH